jgi:hypothetical protein
VSVGLAFEDHGGNGDGLGCTGRGPVVALVRTGTVFRDGDLIREPRTNQEPAVQPCPRPAHPQVLTISILTREVLKRSSSSRDDLASKLMRDITSHNQTAASFKWTYTGDPLEAAS